MTTIHLQTPDIITEFLDSVPTAERGSVATSLLGSLSLYIDPGTAQKAVANCQQAIRVNNATFVDTPHGRRSEFYDDVREMGQR